MHGLWVAIRPLALDLSRRETVLESLHPRGDMITLTGVRVDRVGEVDIERQ